ncbi:hypothetical protein WJX77_005294 [Trebouxia sp. C0004]
MQEEEEEMSDSKMTIGYMKGSTLFLEKTIAITEVYAALTDQRHQEELDSLNIKHCKEAERHAQKVAAQLPCALTLRRHESGVAALSRVDVAHPSVLWWRCLMRPCEQASQLLAGFTAANAEAAAAGQHAQAQQQQLWAVNADCDAAYHHAKEPVFLRAARG